MMRLQGSHHDLIFLFEHDLFGKPASTFPDHALEALPFFRHQLTEFTFKTALPQRLVAMEPIAGCRVNH